MDISGIRAVFEATPIIVGMYALFLLWMSGSKRLTSRYTNAVKLLMMVTIGLLFIAQSSWLMSVIKGNAFGQFFADIVWTVFDVLAMLIIILWLKRGIR